MYYKVLTERSSCFTEELTNKVLAQKQAAQAAVRSDNYSRLMLLFDALPDLEKMPEDASVL